MWMLEKDPEDRPTTRDALKHPWFKEDKSIIKDLLMQNTKIISTPDLRKRRTSVAHVANHAETPLHGPLNTRTPRKSFFNQQALKSGPFSRNNESSFKFDNNLNFG